MWTYLLGPLLTPLPQRWRRALFGNLSINWPRAALISGLLEALGCLAGLIGWYLFFLNRAVEQQMNATLLATKGAPGEAAAFGMGFAALVSFALHPLTWALVYFSLEGVLRTFGAVVAEESIGTLPLALVDRIIAGAQQRAYEARVPLVPDLVAQSDGKQGWDLRVESCRPKPTWKYPLAVRYQDEFYQVTGEASSGLAVPRPHVYLLRRVPAGEAYRGVENYGPEDVLRSAARRPSFLGSLFHGLREKYRILRLPLVADRVYRSDRRDGWHLRVESCRPKPEWTEGRTIRFERQVYRVVASYDAPPPRPFGYRLRLLPAGEIIRGGLDYSPDEPLRKPEE
jgi:hypothetical protein